MAQFIKQELFQVILAMAAGYNMVKTLYDNPSIYVKLEKTTATLENGLRDSLKRRFLFNKQGRVYDKCSLW